MLVEVMDADEFAFYSWHHLLKGTFLEGKHNHHLKNHLNHLLYVLIHNVIPFFIAKHSCEDLGFEGLDLKVMSHQKIEANAHP